MMTINKICRINSGSWKEEKRKRREKDISNFEKKTNEQKITATHTHTKYRKIIIMIETIFFLVFVVVFFCFYMNREITLVK